MRQYASFISHRSVLLRSENYTNDYKYKLSATTQLMILNEDQVQKHTLASLMIIVLTQ
jgi:hypothetical protein